ncbi:MAG: peptidoglycan-binding domain-containing protein [Patescibacteria group bacterium]
MYFKKIHALLLFLVLMFSATLASAATPSVSSLAVNPSSINHGYSLSVSWTIVDGGGHSLLFTCPVGVTVKRDDGTNFPCNTRQSTGSFASGSAGFIVSNVSGTTKSLQVQVIPKDSGSSEYDGGSKSATVYVGTSPQPVTSFTLSATSISPGQSVTFSWIGPDIPGVNFQFDCVSGVTMTSPSQSGGTLPCATPAFLSDLASSGSVDVFFTNSSFSSADINVRILPAIASATYDATHSLSTAFTVLGKAATLVPSVGSFTGIQTSVTPGSAVNYDFSWVSSNTAGVNLQIQCGSYLTASLLAGTTTIMQLPCNTPALTQALSSIGTTSISFSNQSTYSQSLSVSLLPQNADGTYDATRSKALSLIIPPASSITMASVSVFPSQTSSPTGTAQSIKVLRTITFSVALQKGSQNAQVKALQQFLAQDGSLYPEKIVSGYFGGLTESAVKRFQKKYGVAKEGDAGYGLIGPKTRAKLNSLEYF